MSEEEIEEVINDQSNTDLSEDDFKRSLIKLDTETFDRYIRDKEKTALVLFHAKWSSKCKTLLETMKRAARHFKVCIHFLITLSAFCFLRRPLVRPSVRRTDKVLYNSLISHKNERRLSNMLVTNYKILERRLSFL